MHDAHHISFASDLVLQEHCIPIGNRAALTKAAWGYTSSPPGTSCLPSFRHAL